MYHSFLYSNINRAPRPSSIELETPAIEAPPVVAVVVAAPAGFVVEDPEPSLEEGEVEEPPEPDEPLPEFPSPPELPEGLAPLASIL